MTHDQQMNEKEMREGLLKMIQDGLCIAIQDPDGELRFIAKVHATPDQERRSLSIGQVQIVWAAPNN